MKFGVRQRQRMIEHGVSRLCQFATAKYLAKQAVDACICRISGQRSADPRLHLLKRGIRIRPIQPGDGSGEQRFHIQRIKRQSRVGITLLKLPT